MVVTIRPTSLIRETIIIISMLEQVLVGDAAPSIEIVEESLCMPVSLHGNGHADM